MNRQRTRAPKGFKKGYMADFLRKRVIPMHHRGRPRKFWKELSPSETRVYRWLRAHVDTDGRWIGSPSKIAPRARYSTRTIRRVVRRLEELGLARRFKGNGISWGIVLQEPPSFSIPDNGPDKNLAPRPGTGRETPQKSTYQNIESTPVSPRPSSIGQKNAFQAETLSPQTPVKPFEKTSPVFTPPSITGVPREVVQRLVPNRPLWSSRQTRLYVDPTTGKLYYRHDDGKFVLMH